MRPDDQLDLSPEELEKEVPPRVLYPLNPRRLQLCTGSLADVRFGLSFLLEKSFGFRAPRNTTQFSFKERLGCKLQKLFELLGEQGYIA